MANAAATQLLSSIAPWSHGARRSASSIGAKAVQAELEAAYRSSGGALELGAAQDAVLRISEPLSPPWLDARGAAAANAELVRLGHTLPNLAPDVRAYLMSGPVRPTPKSIKIASALAAAFTNPWW